MPNTIDIVLYFRYCHIERPELDVTPHIWKTTHKPPIIEAHNDKGSLKGGTISDLNT